MNICKRIEEYKEESYLKKSYNSEKYKNKYCNLAYKKYYSYYKKNIQKQLDIYAKDIKGDELIELIKDMIYSKKVYGCFFSEYFLFEFKNKSHEERESYITHDLRHEYLKYLNGDFYESLTDKFATYEKYKEFYKREMVSIDENGYKSFESFCKKHKKVVKKLNDSSLGKGLEIIDTTKYDLKKLFDDLIDENNTFILEELIVQGKEMKALHPESVNTLRVIPLILDDGSVVIHRPFLKVGQGDSIVDNGGAGGILSCIDAKTGKVCTDGYDELLNRYASHPNTKIKFNGFQIPDWDGVVKLATDLAHVNLEGRYIGWDLAYSDKGWVVVEGNGKTMFVGQQMPSKEGIRKELEDLINWKK